MNRTWMFVAAFFGLSLVWRLVPHMFPESTHSWANFAPVGAFALFAGARIANQLHAVLLPILLMLVSDLGIAAIGGAPFWHDTLLFVYGSYAAMVGVGVAVRRRVNIGTTALAAIGGSVLFFLVTNFGAWLTMPDYYTRDWAGLLASYELAIPFYRNTFVSDVLFTGLAFGLHHVVAGRSETTAAATRP